MGRIRGQLGQLRRVLDSRPRTCAVCGRLLPEAGLESERHDLAEVHPLIHRLEELAASCPGCGRVQLDLNSPDVAIEVGHTAAEMLQTLTYGEVAGRQHGSSLCGPWAENC